MPIAAYVRSRIITPCVLSLCAFSFAACGGTDDDATLAGGGATTGGSPSIAGSTAAGVADCVPCIPGGA